jgi:hypothetical protein
MKFAQLPQCRRNQPKNRDSSQLKTLENLYRKKEGAQNYDHEK